MVSVSEGEEMITGPLFPFKTLGGEMKPEERTEQCESANTAKQEIEMSRRLIAKKVREHLEEALVHTPESLDILTGILTRLASWDLK